MILHTHASLCKVNVRTFISKYPLTTDNTTFCAMLSILHCVVEYMFCKFQ